VQGRRERLPLIAAVALSRAWGELAAAMRQQGFHGIFRMACRSFTEDERLDFKEGHFQSWHSRVNNWLISELERRRLFH
jgi:hypothetical protein